MEQSSFVYESRRVGNLMGQCLRTIVIQPILASIIIILLALMMEAANSYETPANVYQTTRRNHTEDKLPS
jgi:uncharacterized membrane protein